MMSIRPSQRRLRGLVFLFCSVTAYLLWARPRLPSLNVFTPSSAPPYDLETNPLSLISPLHTGPWRISLPPTVTAGKEFTIRISCISANASECPPAYYIQLYGPTAHTIPHDAFRPVPDTPAVVTVSTTIHTPGAYNLYAYPNAVSCSHDSIPDQPPEAHLYRRLVKGTPFALTVIGVPTFPPPSASPCNTTAQLTSGQWTRQQGRSYHWHPNTCRLPPHTAQTVLQALPSIKTLLFIGDSVTSGYVCAFVYPQLFGSRKGDCTGHGLIPTHGHQHARFGDVDVVFLFVGATGVAGLESELKKVRGPVLVVYNEGLWMSRMGESEVKDEYRQFFGAVRKHFPQEETRVVVRSTTSVIQPVTCFDQGGHGRERSVTLRRWMSEVVGERRSAGERVGFVDAFMFTDQRPETTLDGFHWSPPDAMVVVKGYASWDETVRPVAGEAEEELLKWVWDEAVRMK